jgi:hypothetical protein
VYNRGVFASALARTGLAALFGACVMQSPGSVPEAPATPPATLSGDDDLVVNGVRVSPEEREQFEQRYRLRVPPGAYWYDARSGAWGLQGGPTSGFTRASTTLGGALRADASGGGDGTLTGVFINGRELHPTDVELLAQYLSLVPGRYWVEANGNAGYEGLPAMVNLIDEARSRGEPDPFATAGQGYPAADGQAAFLFEPSVAARSAAPESDAGPSSDGAPAP